MNTRHATLASALLLALAGAPASRAAESYDNCTGFVTSLPAVLATQGTWCMSKDLATSIASGAAITIQGNNITLDCNHFKLGGLAAGIGTEAVGIQAQDRLNATVRNCNIRGFRRGISFFGTVSSGHVVEDNRLEGNTHLGIFIGNGANAVRRNRIMDTGGGTILATSMGVFAAGDVELIDNTIDGVHPSAGNSVFGSYGIGVSGSASSVVQGNRVVNLDAGDGELIGIGIYSGTFATVDGNIIGAVAGMPDSFALFCNQPATVTRNLSQGFTTGSNGCSDDGGNLHK